MLNPICNGQTHTCGTECSESSDCPADEPVCNPTSHTCEDGVDDVSTRTRHGWAALVALGIGASAFGRRRRRSHP